MKCIPSVLCALLATSAFGQTTDIASVATGGARGDSFSWLPSISADGRWVAFVSNAENLVPGGTSGIAQVFLRDLSTRTTELASANVFGGEGNQYSYQPSVSGDGSQVAFASGAGNLVPGDTNGALDVFVRDRSSGAVERVSVSTNGRPGDHDSSDPAISLDGRYVAFRSLASNLVPGDANDAWDIFVRDRLAGTTERVSLDANGVEGNDASTLPSITPDGRYVAFYSAASNLVPSDTNGSWDAFLRDRENGTTERASVGTGGVEGNGDSGSSPMVGSSPSISADGRFVAFYSLADNLVAGDNNATWDIFLRDRAAGTTERLASLGFPSSISADGRFVAFASAASDLVQGDTNGFADVFVRDRLTGATERMSVSTIGRQGNDDCASFLDATVSISADGRRVAFASEAANLVHGDTNGYVDVFVHDRGEASAFASFCAGDGSGVSCPCANPGGPGRGCENSAATGGALLTATGVASLASDTVQLTCAGVPSDAFCVVLQGRAAIPPANYGDGLRCTSGDLERLFARGAAGGTLTVPRPADPTLSARSAASGDPIPLGATRHYQVYYRDPSPSFCPDPPGGTFNVSNAIAIAWGA